MQLSSADQNSTIVRSRTSLRLTRAALQTVYALSEHLGTTLAERLFTSPRLYRRPDREREVLVRAREQIVEVTLRAPRWRGERIPVATWRWGTGPAVLLVHGWEGRGSQLGAFVEPLLAAHMSVIAFDAPGHGNSPERCLYLTDVADCIADVAASADAPLHGIIAHSYGAVAALLAHPRANVSAPRNVAIAPNVIVDDTLGRFARRLGLDDHDRAALEQRLVMQTGVGVDALELDRLAARRDDALLVIHDRDDREVPPDHAARLAATWPDASLVETSGLGHRRILRDPAVISAVVEFVRTGVPLPASDLVREVDRQLGDAPL